MQYTYLAHYGAKGMHWGVRRYQNSDGSLTPLGRARYGVGEARKKAGAALKSGAKKLGSAASSGANAIRRRVRPTSEELAEDIQKQKQKIDYKNQRAELKRMRRTGQYESTTDPDNKKDKGQHARFSEMSDAEINARINRLKNEIVLADLEATKNMGPMKRRVYNAIKDGAAQGVKNIVSDSVSKTGKKLIDSILDIDDSDSNSDNNSDGGKKKNKSGGKQNEQSRSEKRAEEFEKRRKAADAELKARQAERDLKKDYEENPTVAKKVANAAGKAASTAAKKVTTAAGKAASTAANKAIAPYAEQRREAVEAENKRRDRRH